MYIQHNQFNMNFYAASALINASIMSLLFLVLLIKKDKPRAANFFNIMNLSGLLWAASYYFWQTSNTYGEAMFWVQMLMVGAIIAAPTFLHFAAVVAEQEKNLFEVIIFSYLLAALSIILTFFSDNFIAGLETKLSIPFFPTAGVYFIYFLLQWFFTVGGALWLLFKKSRQTEGDEKKFIEVIMITTFISYGAGAVNYFLWFNIPILPVTTLMVSAYSAAVTILLLQGKFYKISLFYFEYFAGIAILVSLFQFILIRKLPAQYTIYIILLVILLATFFLFRSGKNERDSLEKIQILNKKLAQSLINMINSIDAAVIIINKKQEVVSANETALKLFAFKRDSTPKKFFDFVFGNTNKAISYALEDYFETGKTVTTTTLLAPETKNVDMFFSPFTINEENDSTMIMIKDQKNSAVIINEKTVYNH